MKRCPTCKRTYADDGFTFCLDDGALLSAPYDPRSEQPVSTIRSSGPPPTAVLPDGSDRGDPSRPSDDEPRDSPLPPTIASPAPSSDPAVLRPPVAPQPGLSTPVQGQSVLRKSLILLLVIIISVGAVSLYAIRRSQCPDLIVHCSSLASAHSVLTYCNLGPRDGQSTSYDYNRPVSGALSSLKPLLAWQPPILPSGIGEVAWSATAGKITSQGGGQMNLDTSGLSGREITVKATVTGSNWFCAKTFSTSFVAPGPNSPSP